MFMKKRRHAQIMADIHESSMLETLLTPPQSESSDMESDGDIDPISKHNQDDEKPSKYPRTTNNIPSDENDSILAKVKPS